MTPICIYIYIFIPYNTNLLVYKIVLSKATNISMFNFITDNTVQFVIDTLVI